MACPAWKDTPFAFIFVQLERKGAITVSSRGAKPRGDLLVQCADSNPVPGDFRALRLAMTVVGGS